MRIVTSSPAQARRRRTAQCVAGAAAIALMISASPGGAATMTQAAESASTLADVLPHLPQDEQAQAEGLGAGTERMRTAVSRGMFAPALSQLLDEGDVDHRPFVLPAPTSMDELPQLASLPPEAIGAVAGLDAAVQHAVAMLGPLSAADVSNVALASAAGFRSSAAHLDARAAGPTSQPAMPTLAAPKTLPARIAHAVEEAPSAALLVATALETYTPLLRRTASAVNPGLAAVAGCDVVDLPPRLCVASAADNAHDDDYMLTIELGGNDTYAGTAGGAPFPISSDSLSPISVVLDVGGNDRYDPRSEVVASTPTGGAGSATFLVGAGAGAFGGVGFLVDRGGNDVYETTRALATDATASDVSVVVAQGGALLGIGGLVDGEGVDTYRISADDGPGLVTLVGQGAGTGSCAGGVIESDSGEELSVYCDLGLAALLIDHGTGDDRYTIDAGTAIGSSAVDEHGTQMHPVRAVSGQASAYVGTALLSDGGGNDHLSLSAAAVGPESPLDESGRGFPIVRGQGTGYVGHAWLLTGAGTTDYTATVRSTGRVGFPILWAQAMGGAGGGVLDDLAGDDRYRVRHVTDMDYRVTGPSCCRGHANVLAPAQWTFAQGASFTGEALLHDHSGDDSYVFEESMTSSVTLDGPLYDRASLHLSHGHGRIPTGHGAAYAQGFAALVDDEGTDTYHFNVTAASKASAVPRDGVPPIVTADDALMVATAQGGSALAGGAGALLDLGGSQDVFETRVDLDVDTPSDPRGAFANLHTLRVQGMASDGGSGTFVALGSEPTVFSSPNEPAGCYYARTLVSPRPRGSSGDGHWAGCSEASGAAGLAPEVRQTTGTSSVALEFGAAQRDDHLIYAPDVPRLDVDVAVVGADHQPLPGEEVHVFLVEEAPAAESRLWYVTTTTGADGTARARLPLLGTFRPNNFAVLALFDGEPPGPDSDGIAASYAYKPVVFE